MVCLFAYTSAMSPLADLTPNPSPKERGISPEAIVTKSCSASLASIKNLATQMFEGFHSA